MYVERDSESLLLRASAHTSMDMPDSGSTVSSDRAQIQLKLPPTPPSICRSCWEGVFSAHLGLFKPDHEDNLGYSYTTTWTELETNASSGCRWCRFLLYVPNQIRGNLGWPQHLEVTVKRLPSSQYIIVHDECAINTILEVSISHVHALEAWVYTTAGRIASYG